MRKGNQLAAANAGETAVAHCCRPCVCDLQLLGYLVRPSSVPKLMRVFPLTMQVDSILNELGLKAYIVEPAMVEPRRDMGTDIQISG